MEIYYNSMGIPFIVKDGVLYEFSSPNARNIVADLALDIDLFSSIKNEVINKIKSIGLAISKIDNNNNIAITLTQIDQGFYLTQYNAVLSVLNDAEDIQHKVINPQPYNSWNWDTLNKTWVPPIEKPENISEDDIKWDEDSLSWKPNTPSPHNQWVWSWKTQTWEAPIAYPIGAEDNEFIWSDELATWVLNDQTS